MESHAATLVAGDDRVPHPHWCAREPYCQVVDGEVTHTSLPEQTSGATLCLMQVPGTSPWVAILTKDGSLSVPAEMAGGELPDALRRLSRTAITSE